MCWNKKSITIVLLLLGFCCGSLSARPTTVQEAEKVVTGWLKADLQPLGTKLGQQVMKVETFTNDIGEPVYYIVYLQPCGFVIVPADDLVEPIIGFVSEGTYVPSLDNPLGALVINDLNGRIAAVRDVQRLKATAAMETAFEYQAKWQQLKSLADGPVAMGLTSVSDVRVAPLVPSKWWQKNCCTDPSLACYNYYTPLFTTPDGDPNNYVCGCVATAMAQVMRYYQYPTEGIGVYGNTVYVDDVPQTAYTRGGDGSGGPYSWSDMVLVPDCNTTEVQRQAIGALCYDAGVVLGMHYGPSGSWVNTLRIKDALTSKFQYDNAVKGYNSGYDIGSGLIGMVNPNLDAKKPVILRVKPGPGAHAIVCDGYGYNSSTLYHHINMGWGGNYNAWYNLPTLEIEPYPPYTAVTGSIYNIHITKGGDGEMISGRVLDSNGIPIAGATMYAQAEGEVLWITTDSDSKGIYAFDCLDSGTTYTLYPSADGYNFPSQTVMTGTSNDLSSVSGNVWGVDFYGQAGPRPPLFVDDDATYDPAPGNPNISDPCEDGSAEHPFDAIQEAVDAAIPEDTVVVLPGTYTGDGNRDLDFKGKLITVRSANPHDPEVVAETIIDCNGIATERYRGFYFHSGETSTSVLAGFTITNGNASNGGGIYIVNSSPKIAKCVFSSNLASEDGGGICNWGSSPTLTDCIFVGNSANYGGGMYNTNNSTANLTTCILSKNSASIGGGIYNNGSNSTITNCRFSSNQAIAGGGMSNVNNSNPVITNCTFSGNSASYGGGMYSWDSTPAMSNCILWGDTPEEIYVYDSIPVITYSNVQDGWSGTGNINSDPCFADPGNDDYHLLPNSVCIDSGDSNYVPDPNVTDLDGHPRIIDGDCNDTNIIDMGAYEFNYAYMGDLDYNCNIDFDDFAILALTWSTEPTDAEWDPLCDISSPADNYIDRNDLAVLCANWLAEIQ